MQHCCCEKKSFSSFNKIIIIIIKPGKTICLKKPTQIIIQYTYIFNSIYGFILSFSFIFKSLTLTKNEKIPMWTTTSNATYGEEQTETRTTSMTEPHVILWKCIQSMRNWLFQSSIIPKPMPISHCDVTKGHIWSLSHYCDNTMLTPPSKTTWEDLLFVHNRGGSAKHTLLTAGLIYMCYLPRQILKK